MRVFASVMVTATSCLQVGRALGSQSSRSCPPSWDRGRSRQAVWASSDTGLVAQCQWLWPLGHHVPHRGWACFLGRVCVPVDRGRHCISVKSLALELRPAQLCRLSLSASHRLCVLCSPRRVRAGSSQSPRARGGVLRPGEASPDTSQVFPVLPGSTARLGPCARCHPVPSLTRKGPVGRPCCLQSPRSPSQSRGEQRPAVLRPAIATARCARLPTSL